MMRGTIRRISDPEIEPVTLDELKAHARIDTSAEDDYLATFVIPAARDAVEGATGFALMTQTWRMTLPKFPGDGISPITLAWPPLASISSFTYIDVGGASVAMVADTDYQLDAESLTARLAPEPGTSWPAVNAEELAGVTIDFVAGVSDRTDVDPSHRQALLMLAAHWYWNREAAIVGQGLAGLETPLAFERLTRAHRVYGF